jgi:catechol 2,3-dioxygenase-like lactoylglutathione lyase family enzyme
MMREKPTISYWHLWTDADGISRQKRCAMTEFELRSMKPPADPQWQGNKTSGKMTVMFTAQPVGWIGNWHENPKPQWIVPLSGRWFVEAMDGTRVEMGGRNLVWRGSELPRGRWQARASFRNDRRCSSRIDGDSVRRCAFPSIALRIPVSEMDSFDIRDSRFARYAPANGPLEKLAGGFRSARSAHSMTCMLNSEIKRLARFWLTTTDAEGLSIFYQQAVGFRRLAAGRRSGPDFERLTELEVGADSITLGLGDEVVELLQFDQPGRPYPAEATSSDLSFQHFAIVVTDIQAAYQRLCSVGGWTAISTDGPQKLPLSSGGVSAFKFRDPDGHPLELLAFPDGKSPEHWRAQSKSELFLGIDHSAICVSDSERSIAFYETLGLHAATPTLNTGMEQERLDAVIDAQVEVTALEPTSATPHVELLCYRSAGRGGDIVPRSNDIAATRMVFEADGRSSGDANYSQALLDPDGHYLVIAAPIDSFPPAKSTINAGSSPVS